MYMQIRYGIDDQVPTWNYVSVHAKGRLRLLPEADLRNVLDKLSTHFENALSLATTKPPWIADKMPSSKLDAMMQAIAPIVLDVEELDGTWKLAQRKPQNARLGVAKSLSQLSFKLKEACSESLSLGMELGLLSGLHATTGTSESSIALLCSNMKDNSEKMRERLFAVLAFVLALMLSKAGLL